MNTYRIRIKLDGYLDINANNSDEAADKADDYIGDYDFGKLFNIDWQTIMLGKVED